MRDKHGYDPAAADSKKKKAFATAFHISNSRSRGTW